MEDGPGQTRCCCTAASRRQRLEVCENTWTELRRDDTAELTNESHNNSNVSDRPCGSPTARIVCRSRALVAITGPSTANRPVTVRSSNARDSLRIGSAMLRAISEHPVLSALTAVAGVLPATRQLIGSAGLPPFLHDVLTSTLLATCGALWMAQLTKSVEPNPLVSQSGQPLPRRRTRGELIRFAAFACGVLVVVCWSARRPALHLAQTVLNGRWRVCGEFHSRCGRSACLVFSDSENRPSFRGCVQPSDDSGYVSLNAPSLIAYEPFFVAATCDGIGGAAVELTDASLDKSCNGRLMMR
jgi:hypothetical protein